MKGRLRSKEKGGKVIRGEKEAILKEDNNKWIQKKQKERRGNIKGKGG